MKDAIEHIVRNLVPPGTPVGVSLSERSEFGHYSTNVALRLAKAQGKNPLKVAQEISSAVREKAPAGFFEKVEAAPPGFVNFWLSQSSLAEELKRILKEGKKYGRNKQKKEKVQVEFISANPTGPVTLANGRGGFFGDALSNVLEAAGFRVEREYYVNDAGNQILTLGKSMLAAAGVMPEEEKFYKGAYIKEWADSHKAIVKKQSADPMAVGRYAAKDFLKAAKAVIVRKAKIKFDRFTSEYKHIQKKGYADRALALFLEAGKAYKKDGATWLRTTEFGDDKDRVLITSDGFPTYFLADAGHYLETKERKFFAKINILGPDHYGYVARIQAAAALVGMKNSKIIVTQAVRVVRDGKEVHMSKRKGEFAAFEELIDEVGADVARFFFLVTSLESHLDFDLDLAKERSSRNPVFYVQYAYVRAKGILRQLGRKPSVATGDLSLLSSAEDSNLMRALAQFPEILQETAADYQVHRLTRYGIELARTFHAFYEKERVAGEEKSVAAARGILVLASVQVFTNLFAILGISAPSKM